MEWTKETLKYTCIHITGVTQAKRIIEFYKSFGYFENTPNEWNINKMDVGGYIGINNQSEPVVHLFGPRALPSYLKRIKLYPKPRRKFPREMMVSDNKIIWHEKLVYCKIPKVTYQYLETSGNNRMIYTGWKYAKEI